jgi:hypothetical protein
VRSEKRSCGTRVSRASDHLEDRRRNRQPSDAGIGHRSGPDGTIFVAYRTFATWSAPASVQVVKSIDCGKHWTRPVSATTALSSRRRPEWRSAHRRSPSWPPTPPTRTSCTSPIRASWGPTTTSTSNGRPMVVAHDIGGPGPGERRPRRPPPDLADDRGFQRRTALAWYDFRNSITPDNEALDVFYACTNCDGNTYPSFSHSTR